MMHLLLHIRKHSRSCKKPVCGWEVESSVPICRENILGLCRKRKTCLQENERMKTIAEGYGLWLYQGMVWGVISIRVRQYCDTGAWSLERQVGSWLSSTITSAASVGPSSRQEGIQQPRSDSPNGEGNCNRIPFFPVEGPPQAVSLSSSPLACEVMVGERDP